MQNVDKLLLKQLIAAAPLVVLWNLKTSFFLDKNKYQTQAHAFSRSIYQILTVDEMLDLKNTSSYRWMPEYVASIQAHLLTYVPCFFIQGERVSHPRHEHYHG
jgi:hypothetical protein